MVAGLQAELYSRATLRGADVASPRTYDRKVSRWTDLRALLGASPDVVARSGRHAGMMRRRVPFLLAALVGGVHAATSIYWAAGGTALLSTVGAVADSAAGAGWVLTTVAVAKLVVAVTPLAPVDVRTRRWLRPFGWITAVALCTWGAINTVSASLLCAGAIPRPTGYDATATLGHAALWDPMFLLWGIALVVGLWLTRDGVVTGNDSRAMRLLTGPSRG